MRSIADIEGVPQKVEEVQPDVLVSFSAVLVEIAGDKSPVLIQQGSLVHRIHVDP